MWATGPNSRQLWTTDPTFGLKIILGHFWALNPFLSPPDTIVTDSIYCSTPAGLGDRLINTDPIIKYHSKSIPSSLLSAHLITVSANFKGLSHCE